MGRPSKELTGLPPRQVPFAIAGHHPELQLLTADQAGIVHGLVEGAAGFGALLGSVQEQGPPAPDSGWARLEEIILSDGKPAKNSQGETIYRLRLSDETLAAAEPVLAEVLGAALRDEALRGYCWTVQEGVVPGPESGGASAPSWSVTSLGPRYGLELPRAEFAGGDRQLRLTCVDDMARHLGVYGEFRAGGRPIEPSGWKSRLPAGVPPALETATLKYLGTLAPNVPVAGLTMPAGPQTVGLGMPSGADSVDVVFGGFGNGGWAAVPDAAGVMLTFVLDYALPAILASAEGSTTDGWYQKMLADPAVGAEVMAAAVFLVTDTSIRDTAALLDRLSSAIPASLLDVGLAKLREKIDDHLGTDSVANAAPMLGWAAQTVGALLGAAPQAFSRLAAVPGTFSLGLSPDFAVTLDASLEPDASRGDWPDQAATYELVAEYAGGFSQTHTGPVVHESPAAPIRVAFPSVRTDAPIELRAALYDGSGELAADGSLRLEDARPASGGRVPATVPIVDRAVPVSAATRFALGRTLGFDASTGAYAWGPAAPSAATKHTLACEPGKSQLCELVGIAFQQATRSLGYVWRTTDSGVPECGGSGPTSVSYRFQSVGVVDPALPLKTIDCGFVGRPQLAYAASPATLAAFLDPRVRPPSLRAVDPGASGPFGLESKLSLGRFVDPDVSALAIHPAGYAVAVSSANGSMQIVELAPIAVADASAPLSRIVAGKGDREGLLSSPVGVAVAPAGEVLVLDAGLSRVQAFDVYGNPTPMFGGSPFMGLKQETGIEYQDVAASPAGLIYVLSNAAGGQRPADYRLDVYGPDGAFLARTAGVNAARIAVDSAERIYTLDYRSITGPGGRTEPSLGQWWPTG
jgi:hypothetical protein